MHDQPMLSADERGRYARHLILPEVGPAGQLRLKSASVLCVGSEATSLPRSPRQRQARQYAP